MPDYSLTRNNPPSQAQQSMTQQSAPQAQPPQPTQPPPQQQTPLSQLSTASQQAKLETENALLREALAMSAQNCEALITQSNQSLEKINRIVATWIDWLKQQQQNNQQQINQHQQSNQQQLKQLENINAVFSKSLNDVLSLTSDRLIEQVTADVDTAIKANIKALNNATARMEQTADRVTNFEGQLKTTLDKRVKAYDSSIKNLFQLNDKRELFFWLGMGGAILTPIVLIISLIL